MTSNQNDIEEEEKKQSIWQSGYIKMSQSNADPQIYWAEFRSKSNQIHLFKQQASLEEPEEILYLSTCNIKEKNEQSRYIILNDECTGIQYKFEPHQQGHNPEGWVSKIKFFIQECIIDVNLLHTDVSQMNARQQFNRFLLYQHQMARLQKAQLPKLAKAVKKAVNCDEALKDATNWLQRQKLDVNDSKAFDHALSVRNKFWNLLIDTRDFINKGYVSADKICGVFVRWKKMSQQTSKLSPRDKKILVWGLTELSKFTDEGEGGRLQQGKELKKKWKQLGDEIAQCQTQLQQLQQKWKDKVEHAQNVASWCNWIGGILIVGGIIGAVVAAAASAPAWVPYAAGGGIITGLVTVGYGQATLSAHKGIKKKIDDLENIMGGIKSNVLHVQQWVEVIAELDTPLVGIGLGTSDYQPEIDAWEKINDHEKSLLERVAKTFEKFKMNSWRSLDAIRKVQEEIDI